MNTSELKPCPLCGGKAYISEHNIAYTPDWTRHEMTIVCGCGIKFEKEWYELHRVKLFDFQIVNQISAIDIWNRRANNGGNKNK